MAARRSPRKAELQDILRSHGLRVTHQRVAVLKALSRARAPISHPELADRLADQGLDRSTVYRNLLTLTEVGVLVRAELGDHVWRYELPKKGHIADHGLHPHLVCADCGTVQCLPEDAVSLHGEAAKRQVSEVQLRGRCARCASS